MGKHVLLENSAKETCLCNNTAMKSIWKPHISVKEVEYKRETWKTQTFYSVAHNHTLTTGCMVVLGIMNCICWANMAAAVFCWIRLFRPLISSWVFRWAGGWRYLQFSRVQRPWAKRIKSMGEDGKEETNRITSLTWKSNISDQWGTKLN